MNAGQLIYTSTEEQAQKLRRAYPTATVIVRPSPRSAAATAPAGRGISQELVDEVKAERMGAKFGRQFGHDPIALAKNLRVGVEVVAVDQLQDSTRPTILVTGRWLGTPGAPAVIQVADTLDGAETLRVLSHELGHHLMPSAGERACNSFAKAFMTLAAGETAWGRGHAFRQDLLRRARAAARAGGR